MWDQREKQKHCVKQGEFTIGGSEEHADFDNSNQFYASNTNNIMQETSVMV